MEDLSHYELSELYCRRAKAEALPPEQLEPHRAAYELICAEIKQREVLSVEAELLSKLIIAQGITIDTIAMANDVLNEIKNGLRELTHTEQLNFEQVCPEWQGKGAK